MEEASPEGTVPARDRGHAHFDEEQQQAIDAQTCSQRSSDIAAAAAATTCQDDTVSHVSVGREEWRPAEEALQQKWDALRHQPQRQEQEEQYAPSREARAAAIFSSPVPSASARADEEAARRSPPLQPLYTSEPTMPWDGGDIRAGWGRSMTMPRAYRPFGDGASPPPPLPSSLPGEGIGGGTTWLDVSGAVEDEDGQDGCGSPAPLSPLSVGGRGSTRTSFVDEDGGPLSLASVPDQASVARPLECVAAQPIPLDFTHTPAMMTIHHGGRGRGRSGRQGDGLSSIGDADGRAGDWRGGGRRALARHMVLPIRPSSDGFGSSVSPLYRAGRTEAVPDVDDDEEEEQDGMFEGDLRCDRYLLCCCGCLFPSCLCRRRGDWDEEEGPEGDRAPLLGSHHHHQDSRDGGGGGGMGREAEGTVLGRGGVPRRQHASYASAGERRGCSACGRSLRRRLTRMWHFVDVFHTKAVYNTHLPGDSRRYCLLHYAAALAMLLSLTAIAIRESARVRRVTVSDGTACQDHTYQDILRPDLSSSLCCFGINALFALWFALRAARYEKSGFLVATGVVVALQVARAGYFTVYVAPRYFDAGSWVLCYPVMAALNGGVLLSVIATLLSWRVRRAFGWRSFSQGITQPGTLALRRRYMRLQTCLQLDGVVTLNAYLSILFLSDDWPQQVVAGGYTVTVLLALTLLMPALRLARHWWPLLPCLAVLLCSLGYYTYTVSSNLSSFGIQDSQDGPNNDHGDSRDDNSIAISLSPTSLTVGLDLGGIHGRCYQRQLLSCLASRDVYIVTAGPSVVVDAFPPPSLHPQKLPHAMTATETTRYPFSLVLGGEEGLQWGVVPVNGSSTYLPTHGDRADEFFELYGCNYTSCYLARQDEFVRLIHDCCEGYGRCSRKDSVRVYGVALLIFLCIVAFVVHVTLAAVAWRRVVAEDDKAIAAFLQLQRGQSGEGGSGTSGAALPPPQQQQQQQQQSPSSRPLSEQQLLTASSPEVSRRLQWDRAGDE